MNAREEILAAVNSLHTANLNALLVLVQTLEEAGLISADHYAGNLRMHAGLWASHIGSSPAELLNDLADRLQSTLEAGNG